jgi:hypothetical protein
MTFGGDDPRDPPRNFITKSISGNVDDACISSDQDIENNFVWRMAPGEALQNFLAKIFVGNEDGACTFSDHYRLFSKGMTLKVRRKIFQNVSSYINKCFKLH